MGLEQIKVDLLDWWPKEDGDRDIALAAWASSVDKEKAEQRSIEDVLRLVNTVVDHSHDTPKESVWLKFFISFPIFCERQYDKYRMTVQQQDLTIEWYEAPFGRWGITQNELSGRYRTLPERHYSLPKDVLAILDKCPVEDLALLQNEQYENMLEQQYQLYQSILNSMPEEWKDPKSPNNKDYKRAREVFRGILGTSYITDMRIVCNLNAFEHMINQRLAPEAQLESRYTAYLMLKAAKENKVAEETIKRMEQKNHWDVWSKELENVL